MERLAASVPENKQASYFDDSGNLLNFTEIPAGPIETSEPESSVPFELEEKQAQFYTDTLKALLIPEDGQDSAASRVLKESPYGPFAIIDRRNASTHFYFQAVHAELSEGGEIAFKPGPDPLNFPDRYSQSFAGYVYLTGPIPDIDTSRNIQSHLKRVPEVLTDTSFTAVIEQDARHKGPIARHNATGTAARRQHRTQLHPPHKSGFSNAAIRQDERLSGCNIIESVRVVEKVRPANYGEIPWEDKERVKPTKEKPVRQVIADMVHDRYKHQLTDGEVFDVRVIHWVDSDTADVSVHIRHPNDGSRRSEWNLVRVNIKSGRVATSI